MLVETIRSLIVGSVCDRLDQMAETKEIRCLSESMHDHMVERLSTTTMTSRSSEMTARSVSFIINSAHLLSQINFLLCCRARVYCRSSFYCHFLMERQRWGTIVTNNRQNCREKLSRAAVCLSPHSLLYSQPQFALFLFIQDPEVLYIDRNLGEAILLFHQRYDWVSRSVEDNGTH